MEDSLIPLIFHLSFFLHQSENFLGEYKNVSDCISEIPSYRLRTDWTRPMKMKNSCFNTGNNRPIYRNETVEANRRRSLIYLARRIVWLTKTDPFN